MAGTSIDELHRVLDALKTAGVRFWLEGGWGVDVLVGEQTRSHRDIDLDVDASSEQDVLEMLFDLGYRIETDWRPNRVELVSSDGSCVDVHPLEIGQDGTARQASLDGGWHQFDASWFTSGCLKGRMIPCISTEAQKLFHQGYELRESDRHDLRQLGKL